jgi:hypothetical protein
MFSPALSLSSQPSGALPCRVNCQNIFLIYYSVNFKKQHHYKVGFIAALFPFDYRLARVGNCDEG